MYRMVEGERQVFLLTDDTVDTATERGLPPSSPLPCPLDPNTSPTIPTILPTESDPPDVILHSNNCAFALHLSVLKQRCPWFYKQLRQLRQSRDTCNNFKVLDATTLEQLTHKALATHCPLQDPVFDYVRCVVHKKCPRPQPTPNPRASSQEPPLKRKRYDSDSDSTQIAASDPASSRHVRRLFHDLSPVSLASIDDEFEPPRGVLHVEMTDSSPETLGTILEYLYRDHVRLVSEESAFQVAQMSHHLGLPSSMLSTCLTIAIRHVTLATWMDLLMLVSKLPSRLDRHLLADALLAFIKSLSPAQYAQLVTTMPCTQLPQLRDVDLLVRIIIGLVNHIRLMEFWQNLRHALTQWLRHRFQTVDVPSLRALHRKYAPEWDPYVQREAVELLAKPGEGNLFTLLSFGKLALQLRIDITAEMPILWRLIRLSSCQLLSIESDPFEHVVNEPTVWLRGHLQVTYWRAQPNYAQVKQHVMLQYQHCKEQYSQWSALVPPTPSTLAPAASNPANYLGKVQVGGTFYLWGHPICSVYHFLLQTTLFYSPPHGTLPPDLAELVIVSEMQRLPLETLELVLQSDRLRLPQGENTLIRCLNRFFGNDSMKYATVCSLDRLDEIKRLYRCVRWCFLPLDEILDTLERSPRRLELYEMIETALEDPFRRVPRRRPFGWRKYHHAYMENETNVVEFRIEAGDNHLAPS